MPLLMGYLHKRNTQGIAEQLGMDTAEIKPESRLIEDLKADSLDVVAMIVDMENEFSIQIPDEDLPTLRTVADVIAYIEAHK